MSRDWGSTLVPQAVARLTQRSMPGMPSQSTLGWDRQHSLKASIRSLACEDPQSDPGLIDRPPEPEAS